MSLIQKTMSTGFAEPSPQGLGAAVTYAYVCTVQGGVWAWVVVIDAEAIMESIKNVAIITAAILFFVVFIFFLP